MEWKVQNGWMLLATVCIGAILMYFFDASTGPRRRALLRHYLLKSIHHSGEALGIIWRDACSLFAKASL